LIIFDSHAINNINIDRIVVEVDDFWQFIDKPGKKAEVNGLKEEQLNKLSNEENSVISNPFNQI